MRERKKHYLDQQSIFVLVVLPVLVEIGESINNSNQPQTDCLIVKM